MMCERCSGTGEGLSEYDGPCRTCRGTGEVADICDLCGEETECNEDGLCEACQEQVEQEEGN